MADEPDSLECSFTTEDALYLAYMPYVKGGGLFIRTKSAFTLGDHVKLIIQLFTEPEKYPLEGKVIWLTPKGAQGNKPAGIGVQFLGENSRPFCNKLETYLAGMLKSTQSTDTL